VTAAGSNHRTPSSRIWHSRSTTTLPRLWKSGHLVLLQNFSTPLHQPLNIIYSSRLERARSNQVARFQLRERSRGNTTCPTRPGTGLPVRFKQSKAEAEPYLVAQTDPSNIELEPDRSITRYREVHMWCFQHAHADPIEWVAEPTNRSIVIQAQQKTLLVDRSSPSA
jgi:hypothetical protein